MGLISIYKCGSSVVLDNPRDKDFLKIYKTLEESRKAHIENTDHSVNWHFDNADSLPKITLGCYAYPFLELVKGKEIPAIKNFNLIEHKKEYYKLVKKYFDWLPLKHKWWYHIVIAYFMFKKGEMTLTEQEKEMAQQVHDNGIDSDLAETIKSFFNQEEELVEDTNCEPIPVNEETQNVESDL